MVGGGGGGIRTHGPGKGTTVFKTVTIDHSDTPPRYRFYPKSTTQGNFADIFLANFTLKVLIKLAHCIGTDRGVVTNPKRSNMYWTLTPS